MTELNRLKEILSQSSKFRSVFNGEYCVASILESYIYLIHVQKSVLAKELFYSSRDVLVDACVEADNEMRRIRGVLNEQSSV